MNPEKLQHSLEAPEGRQEKEKFEPQMIFDFIRHGQAMYGPEVKQKLEEELGYKWEEVLPTSRVSEKELKGKEALEGKLTPEGEEQAKETVKELIKKIDKDKEKIMLLFGPRLRTIDTSRIILDALEKEGINVFKAREHKKLIDMKKHWLAILEFVKRRTPKEKKPFHYWLRMSTQELHESDLEGLEDIGERMEYLTRIIKRYARMYKKELGLEKKKLRVIAVTHDVNIFAVLKKEGISPEEMGLIKNAQVIELGVNKEGKSKLIT